MEQKLYLFILLFALLGNVVFIIKFMAHNSCVKKMLVGIYF